MEPIAISSGDIIQFGQNVTDMASNESKCIITKVELITESSKNLSESGLKTDNLGKVADMGGGLQFCV